MPNPVPPADPDAAASVVCLACGLCCEGALYTHVGLREDEIAFAEGLELKVVHLDKGRVTGDFYLLPCHYLVDKKCSIYQERFEVCRTYQCMLTENVRAGVVEQDTAVGIVKDLRQRFELVRAELNPEGKPVSIPDLVRIHVSKLTSADVAALSPARQRALLELRVMAMLLTRHIDFHFFPESSGS